MKNVKEISETIIQQKLTELSNSMDADMQALYRRNAASSKGLKCGQTFIDAMSLIKESFSNLSSTMSEQHTWAVKQPLIVRDSLITTLKNQAKFYFEQLNKHAMPHLQYTAKLVGKEQLFEQYEHEITESLTKNYIQVEATIDAVALERRNDFFVRGIKSIFNFVPKIFKS